MLVREYLEWFQNTLVPPDEAVSRHPFEGIGGRGTELAVRRRERQSLSILVQGRFYGDYLGRLQSTSSWKNVNAGLLLFLRFSWDNGEDSPREFGVKASSKMVMVHGYQSSGRQCPVDQH